MLDINYIKENPTEVIERLAIKGKDAKEDIEKILELDAIEPAIRKAKDIMRTGGRIVIITFHSLEDRIVKQTFADMASGCVCPRSLPVCVCGRKPEVKILTKKPILPSEEEVEENPRSRSAKLRVAEKL